MRRRRVSWRRVYWYPIVPGRFSRGAGFMDRDAGTTFNPEGAALAGPVRRALDPYPAAIVGAEVRINDRAVCPDSTLRWESWCQ